VREVVGNVLGIRVSNFALIDFQGMEDVVNALGGIDIYVEKAINDPTFPADDTLHYAPFSIAAGQQHMNGKTALNYSRSRHTTSDFDRSRRQQEVINATKKKALSLGVLTNPAKVSNLLNAVSKHFKTDMTTEQIKALIAIYKDIPSESSQGFVLDTSSDLGLLTSTTDPVAGYIAYPPAGFDKFADIHQWFIKNNPDPLQAREKPTISVVNGGKATDKQMQTLIATLKDYGYTAVLSTATVNKSKYTSTQLFATKTGSDKPFSKNYLGSQFGPTVQNGSPLDSSSDFELIYFPSSAPAANVKK
jgi:anionic cell wall polymer biosynthesis LytR-Cps2A-Psr (LCP) family protein